MSFPNDDGWASAELSGLRRMVPAVVVGMLVVLGGLYQAFANQGPLGGARETSEEFDPLTCWTNQWPRKIRCRGDYCDHVGLECDFVRATVPGTASYRNVVWGDWAVFTWHARNRKAECYEYGLPNDQSAIAGFHCRGPYCREISLYCVKVENDVKLVNCRDSGIVSEEAGGVLDLGRDKLITSMTCSGRYCDNKSFTVCDVVPN